MTTIVDNFNRADTSSGLGTTSDGQATWSEPSGTWGITGNAAFAPSGNGSIAVIDTGTGDGTYQVKPHPFSSFAGLVFRYVDTSNFWYIGCGTTSASPHIRVAGSDPGAIGGVSFGFTPDDLLSVTLLGTSISVAVNGVVQWTLTDSTFQTAGKHGLNVGNAFNTFDDWQATFTPPPRSLVYNDRRVRRNSLLRR